MHTSNCLDLTDNEIINTQKIYTVTTIAGGGTSGFANGTGISAKFNTPTSIDIDTNNNLYVTDFYNQRIRKIATDGTVTTIAGNGTGAFANGTGTSTQFNYPYSLTIDKDNNIYVADSANHRIRKITTDTNVTTFSGGLNNNATQYSYITPPLGLSVYNVGGYLSSSTSGFKDGVATVATFNNPQGIVIDSNNNLFVADTYNHRIRKIASDGSVTHFAGSGIANFSDNSNPLTAQFNYPIGIAISSNGTIYVADTYNHRIRQITSAGIVTTIAGNGLPGLLDGTGINTQFNYPMGIAVDSENNIIIADSGNHSIRQITSAGIVTTIAGTNIAGLLDGTNRSARFNTPNGITIDSSNNIYITDSYNHSIRRIEISIGQ